MPVIVELHLKASYPVTADTRQLHGLACALCEGDGGVEHLGQDKPFSVWPLQPAAGSADSWVFRVGWLPAGPVPAALTGSSEVRLGHVTCAVTEARLRSATHAQLAAGPVADGVRLEFRSPTYFAQNGTSTVLPDPRLILGSWRRSWNRWLPDGDMLRIDDES